MDNDNDDHCQPIFISEVWPEEWQNPKGGLLTSEFINRDTAIQAEVIRRLKNKEIDNETSHPDCLYNSSLRTKPGTDALITRDDINLFRQLKGMPTVEEEEEANRPEPEPEIELPVTIIRGCDANNKEAIDPETLPAIEGKDDEEYEPSVVSVSSSNGAFRKKKKKKQCNIL